MYERAYVVFPSLQCSPVHTVKETELEEPLQGKGFVSGSGRGRETVNKEKKKKRTMSPAKSPL